MPSNSLPSTPFTLAALTVEGRDARSFLQAQLTADLAAVDAASWHPSGWCDPKGRVLAVMLVSPGADAIRLVLPAPLIDTVEARMNMFRIGRDVTISVGPDIVPATDGTPLAWDATRRLSVATSNRTVAWNDWLVRDIMTGLPWILPETAGRFLPQMIGLERLGGLSYRKGCYPGQEVVARVHYRGRVTQRLARFDIEGEPPAPGEALDLATATGVVLYATFSGSDADGSVGLMIVPADARPTDDELPERGARATRWTMVDANHAVLPSGA